MEIWIYGKFPKKNLRTLEQITKQSYVLFKFHKIGKIPLRIKIATIFLMSVLVLGVASYPLPLPHLDQDVNAFEFRIQLANIAFAEEDEDEDEEEEEYEEEEIEDEGEIEDQEVEGEFELEGIIAFIDTTLQSITLESGGVIFVDENTELDDFDSLDELIVGFKVDVDVVLSNSSLIATEIEIQEEDEKEQGHKTKICHIPPGNPSKYHTIKVGTAAVAKHLAHGDTEGPCDRESFPSEDLESKISKKQAEKQERLAEKLEEKGSKAVQRAEKLIQNLEQRIAQLEARLQTLLDKVESGEYFGNIPKVDPVIESYSISFDGSALSSYDKSVVSNISGEIFIENLVTTSKVSKFKVTGGEIFLGDNINDVVFGKARISSSGPSGEKDTMILLFQTIDADGNGNTFRLTLNFDSVLEEDFGADPIDLEIVSRSKISGEWLVRGSGQLSLSQV